MSDRDPTAIRAAAVTMAATLGSWLSCWWVASTAGLHSDVIVLGTVLPVTLARVTGRARARTVPTRLVRLVTLPVVAVAASEVGLLIAHHAVWGGAVFALVMAAAVWVRRFGPAWTSIGTLVSLPFVVLLVAPVAPAPGHEHSGWPAVVAVVALAWVSLAQQLAWRTGFVPVPPRAPAAAPAKPATGLRASTRMAVQLALCLGVAYALGRWWFPDHWTWTLLSAYVVSAGTRGRGDVLHKGVLRLGGAVVGTVAATLVANAFPTGDRTALVLLFVVLALAVWARAYSYAYWAAGVTAMLALLHGYYGQHGAHLLVERLAGVVLGAVVAVAVAWFVLPVRSSDAFRRRWADALAATGELLTALRTGPEGVAQARQDLAHAVGQLELLEPAYRLHRRTLHRPGRPGTHPADLVAALREVREGLEEVARLPPEELAAHRAVLVAWARRVGAVRRRMRPDADPGQPAEPAATPAAGSTALDRTTAAILRLDALFSREVWRSLGGT